MAYDIKVETTQKKLLRLGFSPGPIDGEMGPKTEAAIVAFQKARKLIPNGVLTSITLAELDKVPAAAKPAEPRWLATARKYIGMSEVKGSKHNPKILRFWQLIRAPFTDDETPWCAGFIGGILEEHGIKSTRSAAARSYLKFKKLSAPRVGCICVLERGPAHGHVFFFEGFTQTGNPVGVGGNQGDKVSRASFDKKRVLGYFWPPDEPVPPAGPIPTFDKISQSSNEA